MTRTVSKRKALLRLLGESGLRDFKGKNEMEQAKVLYDMMVKNDQDEGKQEDLLLMEVKKDFAK